MAERGSDMRRNWVLLVILVAACTTMVHAQQADTVKARPTLGVVGTAHLDTQWRWTIRQSIDEFIPATFADNYRLMDLYPDYVFSFEGAFRYMLLKEYRPDLYARLKPLVDAGRWRVTGSWVDAVDVNLPSFESLVRHVLYGNGYFKREFGVTSRDVFLPDCFGFGYALPSIAHHCGLQSFSTQKLTWGSAYGVPFDIGIWEGVDGSSLVAALNPDAYVSQIKDDLSRDSTWLEAAQHQYEVSGLPVAYHYFGTGDTGGAPDSASVDWLEKSIHSDGPLKVASIGADDIVDMAAQVRRAELPHYKGELLMTRHGVGCYTSEAAMKRWNRKNELIAGAAERASVIADLFGGATYPRDALRDLWIRFLWHQFHDDLTGTSIPEAYEFSWNDEILCQNRFAAILEQAMSSLSPALDTRAKGVPLIVYNPLGMQREDVVEATVTFDDGTPEFVSVFGPNGKEAPSQTTAHAGDSVTVVFLATVPSVGFAVYDVRPAKAACTIPTGLAVTANSLENDRYRVTIDDSGDVTSIYDNGVDCELLSGSIQLQMLFDKPNRWPAWEIDYDDIMAAPEATVGGTPEITIAENGPARVALRITRKTDHSVFHTTISLAAGSAGDRVVFDEAIDWYERETLLKASFPLTSANERVTYDLGLGTIERGLNHAKLYEVPAHQWADMTALDGSYGVAVFSDSRYGWDHPDSNTLRLSLVHTPGVFDSWSWVGDQSSQDKGHHRLSYAVCGHTGDWRDGDIVRQAARFNEPLIAFQTVAHAGSAGNRFSLISVETLNAEGKWSAPKDDPGVMINAVKKSEDSDQLVVRLRETRGQAIPAVRVRAAYPILAATEVNGAEEPIGDAVIEDGALITSLGAYRPRAFALTLASTAAPQMQKPVCQPVALDYNLDGISTDNNQVDGDFENGRTLAGELLPDTLMWLDMPFTFGSKADGAMNVVRCEGQTIAIPSGDYNSLCILATAAGGPAQGTFGIGSKTPNPFSVSNTAETVWIQDYAEKIGQWDNRLVAGNLVEEPGLIAPEYINRAPVAWYGTHRHSESGENESYQFTYLYLVRLDIPDGAEQLTLPDNPAIRVFAATAVQDNSDAVRPTKPLYDVADATIATIASPWKAFVDSLVVTMGSPNPGTEVHYTLDGSMPTAESPLYAGPVSITETATVKARALRAGADDGYVASATYHRLTMRDPVTQEGLVPGLQCRYYEGSWDSLPGFDTMAVLQTLVLDTVAVPDIARDEDYGVVLTGFVKVPHDGLYNFYLSSDDGSDLLVSDTLVVDNDGLHGMGAIAGGVGLRAGLHPLTIHMFQKKGDEGLALHVDGPGMPEQTVPSGWLFHAPESKRR